MNTQNTPTANSTVTYDIRISERQRHYLHKALAQFNSEDPGWEEDEMGQDIPTTLESLLENSPSNPLSTDGINSFVL